MKYLQTIAFCTLLFPSGYLKAQEKLGTITTVAGGGTQGTFVAQNNMNGVLATEIRFDFGTDAVGVDARGIVYLSSAAMYRLQSDSILVRFFGGGSGGVATGDGIPAESSGYVMVTGLPRGMAGDAKGNIYVADPYFQRIRRVDLGGYIWTFAGPKDIAQPVIGQLPPSPQGAFFGDGGPATQARLNQPTDVALDNQGNVYIADSANGRIRKVDPDGFISTFAGNGGGSLSPVGDGGPANQAALVTPYGVAVDGKGNVYIADFNAHRVRKVSSEYLITTLAGTGTAGFSGDGGPANQARLNNPSGVAVDRAGNVYVADRQNNRVRRGDARGTITTFAGTGIPAFSGDGGPAAQAALYNPFDVAVDDRGYVYIADTGNNRVRRVSPLETLPDPPLIRFSASSLSFDNTDVGTVAERTFPISNTGKAPLEVSRIGVEGTPEFRVSPTSATVAPGGSQTVTVTFAPLSSGQKTASLTIVHNAVGSPSTIPLNGYGVPVLSPFRSPDFNGDGRVNFDDFFMFAAAFGQTATGDNARFDLDGDGKINFDDFFLFAARFGK